MPRTEPAIELSIVAPAHNEQDNVGALVEQIVAAVGPLGLSYEIVIVDDGSTDRTGHVLGCRRSECPALRVMRMANTPRGRGHGQSAAFHAAFRASRGELIAVMDADLQNDPADLPAMLQLMRQTKADMIQGDRSHARRDDTLKRCSSLVGRVFRRALLGDDIRDTGCSLRLMRREVALAIPLEFRGMHRFIPVTARRLGYRVVEMPVNHRPRVAGTTKYGMLNRAIPGLLDCLAVRWMFSRRRPVGYLEIELFEAASDDESSRHAAKTREEASTR